MRRLTPLLLLAVLVPLTLWYAVQGLGRRADREALQMTKQSIRRAAVQCYALEGAYPTGLEYLKEHYGVTVDEDRFLVDYRYVGSNLLPDIEVFPIS